MRARQTRIRQIVQEMLRSRDSENDLVINHFLDLQLSDKAALKKAYGLFFENNQLRNNIAGKLEIDANNQEESYLAEVAATKSILLITFFNEIELQTQRKFNLSPKVLTQMVNNPEAQGNLDSMLQKAHIASKKESSPEGQAFDAAHRDLAHAISEVTDPKLLKYAQTFQRKVIARKANPKSKIPLADLTLAMTLTTSLLRNPEPTTKEIKDYRAHALKLKRRSHVRVIGGIMLGLLSATIATASLAIAVMSFGSLAPISLLGFSLAIAMSIGAAATTTGTLSLAGAGTSTLLFRKRPMTSMRKIADIKAKRPR